MHLKKIIAKAFTQLQMQQNQKLKAYRCQYCGKTYAYHVSRMAKHLKHSCISCPASIRNTLKSAGSPKSMRTKKRRRKSSSSSEKENSFAEDSNLTSDVEKGPEKNESLDALGESSQRAPKASDLQGVASTSRTNSQSMIKFCDKMSLTEKSRLDDLLAIAIYASGTPLSITENEFWKDFFDALRPSFKVPSRHQISSTLLQATYDKLKLNVDEKVQSADYIGLQCDGWSNIRNEGIINFIITTPDPVFYKTMTTSTNTQTAEYIAGQMKDVIDTVGAEKLLGVCTDNAATMTKSWRILEDQYPEQKIAFCGCVAHILNLFIKDAMNQPSIDTVTKNATAIVRAVKESHVLSALFAEIQGQDPNKITTTLKLPVKTRFGSLLFCLESVLENKHNLQALAISPRALALKAMTKNIILGDEFWTRTTKTLSLLKPVGQWITKLEGDNPRLSEVPEAFNELKNHFVRELEQSSLRMLSDAETKTVLAALKKRESMAIRPIHLAANILDPSFKGRNLSDAQSVEGASLIFELAPKFRVDQGKVLEELTSFQTSTGLWGLEYVKRASSIVSPLKWWKGICGTTKLGKIAAAVLSLPATSAATERSFSTFGWIHTVKRNRLSSKRAGMITYIAHNSRHLRQKGNVHGNPTDDEDDAMSESGAESPAENQYENIEILEEEFMS